jgi:hypothetical protein
VSAAWNATGLLLEQILASPQALLPEASSRASSAARSAFAIAFDIRLISWIDATELIRRMQAHGGRLGNASPWDSALRR